MLGSRDASLQLEAVRSLELVGDTRAVAYLVHAAANPHHYHIDTVVEAIETLLTRKQPVLPGFVHYLFLAGNSGLGADNRHVLWSAVCLYRKIALPRLAVKITMSIHRVDLRENN
jgi:hypothetical protein